MLRYFLLLLLFLSNVSLGQAKPVLNRLDISLNGQPRVTEYRFWTHHPYVKLKDTHILDWMPYLDAVHNLADISACIRLEPNSDRVTAVWHSRDIRGVALGSELPKLAVPTRVAAGELWIPVDSVAEAMGYRAKFNAQKQFLELVSSAEPYEAAFPNYCQYVLQRKE